MHVITFFFGTMAFIVQLLCKNSITIKPFKILTIQKIILNSLPICCSIFFQFKHKVWLTQAYVFHSHTLLLLKYMKLSSYSSKVQRHCELHDIKYLLHVFLIFISQRQRKKKTFFFLRNVHVNYINGKESRSICLVLFSHLGCFINLRSLERMTKCLNLR